MGNQYFQSAGGTGAKFAEFSGDAVVATTMVPFGEWDAVGRPEVIEVTWQCVDAGGTVPAGDARVREPVREPDSPAEPNGGKEPGVVDYYPGIEAQALSTGDPGVPPIPEGGVPGEDDPGATPTPTYPDGGSNQIVTTEPDPPAAPDDTPPPEPSAAPDASTAEPAVQAAEDAPAPDPGFAIPEQSEPQAEDQAPSADLSGEPGNPAPPAPADDAPEGSDNGEA